MSEQINNLIIDLIIEAIQAGDSVELDNVCNRIEGVILTAETIGVDIGTEAIRSKLATIRSRIK